MANANRKAVLEHVLLQRDREDKERGNQRAREDKERKDQRDRMDTERKEQRDREEKWRKNQGDREDKATRRLHETVRILACNDPGGTRKRKFKDHSIPDEISEWLQDKGLGSCCKAIAGLVEESGAQTPDQLVKMMEYTEGASLMKRIQAAIPIGVRFDFDTALGLK